jgi:pimeloyl-ACP methyl ester carboxylesterase
MPYAFNDGVRIRYEIEGSGSPLLLHTGFAGGLEDWADAGYVTPLARSHRLVLLDPRGQGRSDKPHDPGAYTGHNRVGDVLAVLDAAGIDRAHYLGYSLGGWVGFALGVFAPHRVTSLMIGGAHPFSGNPRPVEGDYFMEATRDGMAPFVSGCEADGSYVFVSAGERARWLANDVGALRAVRLNNLTEPDLEPDAVATIHVPTLIYAGTEDDPEPKEQAAHLLPEATFIALDGLDHAAAFGRSDLVLPHLQRFLGGKAADGTPCKGVTGPAM